MRALSLALVGMFLVAGCSEPAAAPLASSRHSSESLSSGEFPTTQQVIASKIDLWGEAALRQPGGPSYEFFKKLLPPLRYVDADFHFYPIVLSAPDAMVKGRLISNGSQINALARQPNWINEEGTPVHVLVGAQREVFGSELSHLDGPKYAGGYLPIVRLRYEQSGQSYGEEAFASVDPKLVTSGAVLSRFDFPAAGAGRIELLFESGHTPLVEYAGAVYNGSGKLLAAFDGNWEFNRFRSALTSRPDHAASGMVVIFTEPADPAVLHINRPATTPAPATGAVEEEAAGAKAQATAGAAPVDLGFYVRQREQCEKCWKGILDAEAQVIVPEKIVNNARRALLIQQREILRGDHLNYSASNQYARMYANECGDSMRSLLLYGDFKAARKVIEPLFVYRRPNIELHDAAFKLQLLADYYFYTRDASLIRQLRPLWQREVDLILSSRDKASGLLPREKYCSDIATPVHSLNADANCWRGLRDMSIVLSEIGETSQSQQLAAVCTTWRKQILDIMNRAIVRSVDPPFVPVALGGEEPVHDPITATRMGSYWGLVIPCVLWSGLFPIDSPPADDIMRYIRTKGGLCMGMTRVQSAPSFWMNIQNIDDLYGLRYQLSLLKRDQTRRRVADADRALVGFYGKLAQGMTRDTFIDGESSGIVPLGHFGRQLYLPPNSAANASFLIQLRNLLVQDWDLDGDGKADCLRLLFATPRAWLDDGKQIEVHDLPTKFGKLSMTIQSHLKTGQIEAELELPPHAPENIRLRLRLPAGWKITGATANTRLVPVIDQTLDLTRRTGRVRIIASIGR